MRRLLGTGLLFALLAASAHAQGIFNERPGDVLVVEGVQMSVYRIDGFGSTQSISPPGAIGRIRPNTSGNYAFVDGYGGYFDVIGVNGGYGPGPIPTASGSIVDVRVNSQVASLKRRIYGDSTFFVLDSSPGLFATRVESAPVTLHVGAPLQFPTAFVADPLGNMWIGDSGVGGILYRSSTGAMSTLKTGFWCDNPADLALDHHGNLIVANSGAFDGIFRVDPLGGVTTVLIGSPMVTPSGIAVRENGNYIVTDAGSGSVFDVTPGGAVSTITNGIPLVSSPVEVEPIENMWVTDSSGPGAVFTAPDFRPPTTIVSGGPWSGNAPDAIVQDRRHGFVMVANDIAFSLNAQGMMSTLHLGFPLVNLNDVQVDAGGNYVLAGSFGPNGMLWRMDGAGAITTMYDGAASHSGAVERCDAVTFGPFGELLIADSSAEVIWRLSSDLNVLTTFYDAGSLGTLESIAWHQMGLCIADGTSLRILHNDGSLSSIFAGTVRTVAGRHDGGATFAAVGFGASEPTTMFRLSPDGYVNPFNGVFCVASDVANAKSWYREGDLIVSTDDGMLFRQQRWGQSSITYFEDRVATAINQAWGFEEFVATVRENGQDDSMLLLLRPDSQVPVWTGAPLDSPSDVVRDENGAFAVTDNGATKALFRFAPDGSVVTIYSGAPLADPTGLTIDVDTGDYVIADPGATSLFRVTRGGQLTTITGNVNARVVTHDPRSGHFFVGGFGSLTRVTRAGATTVIASGLDFVTDIVLTENATLLTVQVGVPNGGGVFEYDRNGNFVGQSLADPELEPWAAAIAYNDKLKGSGTAQIGSTYELCVDAPGDAGVGYNLLAALALRPGIPTQGRTIAIRPDAITAIAAALPTVFRRFAGSLDSNGHAAPSIALPNDPNLVGVRIFVGGFSFQAGYGTDGVRTVMNSVGFTIR